MPQSPKSSSPVILRIVVPIVLVALIVLIHRLPRLGKEDPLVVYCAHDAVYSEKVLRAFEKETGIRVAIRFDTEATKSLGLVEQLIREKDNPRCDVFWNNQLLGTLDLADRGILQPYKGTGYERIPDAFKDPDGLWAGFGARLRVYIVNTDEMKATPEEVAKRLEGDLSRVAIAKPLYGTTLTHYSVLRHLTGADGLEEWHLDTRKRGIREVLGNSTVKNLVASGVCDLGYTDTDDFFAAKDEGKPVEMLPVKLSNGATICIPNTVAVVKGTTNAERAGRLVDYLLSEKCERELAASDARQIPLGPVDPGSLSEEVSQLKEWAESGYGLTGLHAARKECLAWLKSIGYGG
jgi:iron(III) transport system substrate-binding protein